MQATLRATLASVAALLLGYGLMQTGNALQGTLLSLRAGVEGFSAATIGLVGAAFWVGVVAGSLRAGRLVRRVGHTRTFAALAALASTAALLHLLVVHPVAWVAVRAMAGFCFAGLFMTVESWLNAEATPATRGQVLGLYAMTGLTAGVLGQGLLVTVETSGFVAFCIVAAAISLALVPVALSGATAPAGAVGEAEVSLPRLYAASPFGVVAAPLCGFTTSAFFTLMPAQLQAGGMGSGGIAAFLVAATLGGFALSWPAGRLSDLYDRRLVAVGMAAVAAGVVLALTFAIPAPAGLLVLCAAAAVFGAAVMPIYGVVVAHVNDSVTPGEYVAASGGMLIMFGLGSAAGPVVAGAAMSAAGPRAIGPAIAAALVLVVAWGLLRRRRRAAPPPEAKEAFAIAPAVPVGTALHPPLAEKASAEEPMGA